MLHSVAFADIHVRGDLAVRSGLNFARLEGQWYRPDEVFKADSHDWPGDWEGRVLLALTLLEQSTHRASAYLEKIWSLVPAHLNERGYFGPVTADGRFHEQHFGGHSWMFRALAEYYAYRHRPETLAMLTCMVDAFLMPAKGAFARYPIEPVRRFEQQDTWVLSQLQTKTRHHAETSDAGCVFIMIDGASAAYALLRRADLREAIDEMIDRFMEMDLEALHIQTHATLSASRGILRMYELTGEARYLDMARRRYALYTSAAWSEAYGNYNWFGAPRWTEPCAIIDSFMVAMSLWKHTGDSTYLHDAQLIYYNALCHGHRVNGSFGTDRCCGAQEAEENLFLSPINYETYWCCTMRGGEGFSRAIEYSYFTEDDTIYIPCYNPSEATLRLDAGMITLSMDTHYPYDETVRVRVLDAALKRPVVIKFFVPRWANGARLTVNAKETLMPMACDFAVVQGAFKQGDEIELTLPLSVRREEAAFAHSVPGCHKVFFGPMLLGLPVQVADNSLDGNRFENYAESRFKATAATVLPKDAVIERIAEDAFSVRGTDWVLNTLCSVRNMTREDTMRQVLFQDEQYPAR